MKTVYIIDQTHSLTKIYGLTLLERTIISASKLNPAQIKILTSRSTSRLNQVTLSTQRTFPKINISFHKKVSIKTPVSATLHANKIYHDQKAVFTYSSPKDIFQAREALFQTQKIPRFPPSDFSQHFFSYCGKQLLPLFFWLNFSANQVTYLSILLAVVAAGLMGVGTHLFFLTGCFVAILAKVLDYVDGRVARLRHQVSEFGVRLDPLADRSIWVILVVGSTVGVFRIYGSIFVATVYITPSLIFGFSQLLYILTKKKQSPVPMHISYLLSYFSQTIFLLLSVLAESYLLFSLLSLPLILIHLTYSIHNFFHHKR